MRIVVSVLVISTMTLAGCSGLRDSRANPANWFGQSKSERLVESSTPPAPGDRQTGNPLIEEPEARRSNAIRQSAVDRSGLLSRPDREEIYEGSLIDEVTALRVARVPTGAIIRVTGLPQREGAFDVRLIQVNPDGPVNGVMEYTLNAYQPVNTRQGSVRTREVEVGTFLSNKDLEQITEIRIVAERNQRSTTR
jgi:hypothetical protein